MDDYGLDLGFDGPQVIQQGILHIKDNVILQEQRRAAHGLVIIVNADGKPRAFRDGIAYKRPIPAGGQQNRLSIDGISRSFYLSFNTQF